MSFLFINSKKQLTGNNLNDNKNKDNYKNIITNQIYNEKDMSKLNEKLKTFKIYSPKYKTLKNSRKK